MEFIHESIAGLSVRHNGGSSGKLILFIHGAVCTSSVWKYVFETLGTRHRLMAVDMPGHGLSHSKKPVGEMSMQDYAEGIAPLCRHFSNETIHLVTHSGSGPVGLKLASVVPNIGRQVLFNCPPVGATIITRNSLFRALKYIPKFWKGEPWMYTREDYLYLLCGSDYPDMDMDSQFADWLYYGMAYASGKAAWEMVARKVTVPALDSKLLFVGTRGDRIVPVRFNRRHLRMYPHAETFEFLGNHMSVYDPKCSWVFTQHIIPWLEH